MKFSEFVYNLKRLAEFDIIPQSFIIDNSNINNNIIETNQNIANYQDYKYLIIDSNFSIHQILSYDDSDINNIKFIIDYDYQNSFNDNIYLFNEFDFLNSTDLFKSYNFAKDILQNYLDINNQNNYAILVKYSVYILNYKEILARKEILLEEGSSGSYLKYKNDNVLFPFWLKVYINSFRNNFISKLREEDVV